MATDEGKRLRGICERLAKQPTAVEKRHGEIQGVVLKRFFSNWIRMPSMVLSQRVWMAFWVLFNIFRFIVMSILHLLGLIKLDNSMKEIVPNQLWQIAYSDVGSYNNATLIRGSDGSLMLFQAPPLTEENVRRIGEKGTLKVILEPDSAHDKFARRWKLAFPELTFLCSQESRREWKEAGDDQHIDGCFDDENDINTKKLMEGFGFISSIPGSSWIMWEEFAHIVQLPSPSSLRIAIMACPTGNMQSTHPFERFALWVSGLSGFRIFFHAPFMYCREGSFTRGGNFDQFIQKLQKAQPSLLIFKHGPPLPGSDLSKVRIGLRNPVSTRRFLE